MPSMVLGPFEGQTGSRTPPDCLLPLLDGLSLQAGQWGLGSLLHYCPVLRGSSWAEASQAAAWEQCVVLIFLSYSYLDLPLTFLCQSPLDGLERVDCKMYCPN